MILIKNLILCLSIGSIPARILLQFAILHGNLCLRLSQEAIGVDITLGPRD